jgi:hypothetical protein
MERRERRMGHRDERRNETGGRENMREREREADDGEERKGPAGERGRGRGREG